MLFKPAGQDRISRGLLKSLASVQQVAVTATPGNTPMYYDGADLNSTTPQMQLGQTWTDMNTGNTFQYVRPSAALAPGQFVGAAAPTTGTATAAGSTTAAQVTNVTTTVSEAGNYLWFLDAVGIYLSVTTPFKQSLRQIKSNTIGANATFTLSVRGSIFGNNQLDPDVLPSVPANGSALCLIRPFRVIVATASVAPIGVSLAEVTSGNYTIIQIGGLAMVQANNVVAATAVNVPGVMQAAGVFSGASAASNTMGAAGVLPLLAFNSATTSLIPAYVNFAGA